ncbi:MAG: N-methyl-L-tryptophan oxidase [Planctomycetes bacterium]|nr:N-methyl-L-tryptophan oxidase [Planctomycetota bacterium]
MGDSFEVIVLGVGAMGSSTCYELARRGIRTLGLEQFPIAHTLGSTTGHTRLIRQAYYEHPDYVPLLLRAYERWADLEAASGRKLLHITGGIYMGPPDRPFIAGSLAAARQFKLPHELLTHEQLAARYPMFTLPADHVGLFEPMCGALLCENIIETYARLAQEHGATIHDNTPVLDWTGDANGVTVRTSERTFHADKLIVTAGAWSSKLLADLNLPLRVTRQILGWTQPPEVETFKIGRFPCWAIENEAGNGLYYGFPQMPGDTGVKSAHHHHGSTTTPDTIDRQTHDADADDFLPALRRYVPSLVGPVRQMKTCMYTLSSDEHFIIDQHPHHERVTFAAGFSGHGFKFASVMGEALADLAMRDATELPIGFLSLKRFA